MKNALITGKTFDPQLAYIFDSLQKELAILGINSFITNPHDLPISRDFDIVFSIGGDGSFVSAARKYAHHNVPIIAIKGGTVGFLANIDPVDFKTHLPPLFQPNNVWTKRMLLSGYKDKSQPLVALNEFLFSSEKKGSLSEFSVYINEDPVIHIRADGILLATPTGSTAYNLSAGGPIALPDMELITITPVCSHILGERPFVIDLKNSIKIINHSLLPSKIWSDGQDSICFQKDEMFYITQPLFVNSLYISSKEFFNTLSYKLGWGSGIPK